MGRIMSILKRLAKELKIETAGTASPESEIQEMLAKSPIRVPDEYIEILREKSEIEISINGDDMFRLWNAAGCIELNDAYNIQKYLPHSWAIGDDEGGYAIVYAEEKGVVGVYAVSFGDLDNNEKIYIAPSLFDFLVKGQGISIYRALYT